MASVQELLALAQAQNQTPFQQFLGSASQGVQNGYSGGGLDTALKLVQLQAAQQQSAHQKVFDNAIEQITRGGHQSIGEPVTGATPAQKMKTKLSVDSAGKGTVTFEPDEATTKFSPDQVGAINSRDPQKLAAAFPDGVPKEALGYTYSAERIGNLADERQRSQEERDMKRRERRSDERTKIVDRFNADQSVKKAQASIDGAGMISALANTANPIANAAIPTFMARASGEVGNLSEADKAPFGGSQAIVARLQAAATQATSGQLTEENRRFINELSSLMENRAKENIRNLAAKRAKQYSRASDFLNESDILSTLYPEDEAGAAAPGTSGGTMSVPKVGETFNGLKVKAVRRKS